MTEVQKTKTTKKKPIQNRNVALKSMKIFHSQPTSRITVEEMVSIIYQHYFEYDECSGIYDAIQKVAKEHQESFEFVNYCVGKMILSGVSFKR